MEALKATVATKSKDTVVVIQQQTGASKSDEELKAEVVKLRKQIETIKNQPSTQVVVQQSDSSVVELTTEISSLTNKIDSLNVEIEALRKEVGNLQTTNADRQKALANSEQVKQELKELRLELAKKQAVPVTTTNTVDNSKEINQLNATIERLLAKITELENKVIALSNQAPKIIERTIREPAPTPPPAPKPRTIIRTVPVPTPAPPARVIVAVEPYGDIVNRYVPVNIFFDVNSSYVKPSEEEKLYGFLNILNKYGEAKLSIKGYTDKTGNAAANLKLSKERAEAVKNKLVNNFGVNPTKLFVSHYGEKEDVKKGSNPLGRKVELRLIK